MEKKKNPTFSTILEASQPFTYPDQKMRRTPGLWMDF